MYHFLSIVVLVVGIFPGYIHGMQQASVPCFDHEAQNILTKGIDKLQSGDIAVIGDQFNQENNRVCMWFAQHAALLTAFLKQQEAVKDGAVEVKIMGSHRWRLNHWLSDIDAVVVTEVDPEYLMSCLSDYYQTHAPSVKPLKIKTAAGLHLFILKSFEDKELGHVKLEYTVQTPAINEAIITGMHDRLVDKFGDNQQEKTRYALRMMQAVAQNDNKKQLELKEWTRVLPVSSNP